MIALLLPPFQQWLLFSGVLLLVGCVAWRFVVAPGALRQLGAPDAHELGRMERKVATVGLVVTLLLVAVWALRMVVQLIGFRDPFVPLSEDLAFLVQETFWGTVWVWQGALLPLLAAAFWMARPGDRSDSHAPAAVKARVSWGVAGLLVGLLAVTLALSSHAAGVQEGRTLAVTADALHAVAGGAWIGSLALILGTTQRGAAGPAAFAAQLRSFSPMAIVSVAVLVGMGVFLGWTHLPSVADLWGSTYGRWLCAKVAFAGMVLLVGWVNWQQGLPSLETPEGHRRVRMQAGWEVTAAAVVLLLTGILSQTAQP